MKAVVFEHTVCSSGSVGSRPQLVKHYGTCPQRPLSRNCDLKSYHCSRSKRLHAKHTRVLACSGDHQHLLSGESTSGKLYKPYIYSKFVGVGEDNNCV